MAIHQKRKEGVVCPRGLCAGGSGIEGARSLSSELKFGLDGSDWPNREASRFVEAAGLTWHVQVLGRGPVVLCLHSTGASSHSFARLARILSTTFTVVVPDLPGHGFTDMPPSKRMGLDDVATNVSALLQSLELKPHIVVGHGAGAAVLIEMCLENRISPQRIIAINGALLPSKSPGGQLLSRLVKPLILNGFSARVFAWLNSTGGIVKFLIGRSGSNIPSPELALYERLMGNRAHVAAAMSMMAEWDLVAFGQRLKDLNVPLVLAVGTEDRAVSPDDAVRLNELLPSAKVVRLRGLGHLAHEAAPDKIAQMVSNP